MDEASIKVGKDELNDDSDTQRKNTVPSFESSRHDPYGNPVSCTQLPGVQLPLPGIMTGVVPQMPVFQPRFFYSYYPTAPYTRNFFEPYPTSGNFESLNIDYRPKDKKRRSRTVFTQEQLDILEEGFAEQRHPDSKFRQTISSKTGLPEDRVQVWFQNRRAKQKRLQENKVFRDLQLHSGRVDSQQLRDITQGSAESCSTLGSEVREVLRAAEAVEEQSFESSGQSTTAGNGAEPQIQSDSTPLQRFVFPPSFGRPLTVPYTFGLNTSESDVAANAQASLFFPPVVRVASIQSDRPLLTEIPQEDFGCHSDMSESNVGVESYCEVETSNSVNERHETSDDGKESNGAEGSSDDN